MWWFLRENLDLSSVLYMQFCFTIRSFFYSRVHDLEVTFSLHFAEFVYFLIPERHGYSTCFVFQLQSSNLALCFVLPFEGGYWVDALDDADYVCLLIFVRYFFDLFEKLSNMGICAFVSVRRGGFNFCL